MTVHEALTQDHSEIKQLVAACQEAVTRAQDLPPTLKKLQAAIQRNFRREEVYYRLLDTDKRVGDRVLMHQLRNDHAAVLFTLESLQIRLRKNGVTDDWKQRYQSMLDVLLPHFKKEESVLFPSGGKILTPDELKQIQNEIDQIG